MSETPLEPSKVCEQFNAARVKAEKIFNKLRVLPAIGGCWKPSFEKAFTIYSKVITILLIYIFIYTIHSQFIFYINSSGVCNKSIVTS